MRIEDANEAVIVDINRANLFFLSSFGTNTLGLLLGLFANNQMPTLDLQTILGIVSPTLRSVAATSGRLVNVVDPTRTCGQEDYQSILQEYSMFTHLPMLFGSSSYESDLSVAYHPLCLKYKASEFGQALKDGLGCLVRSGVPASDSLIRTINQLVCAIEDRLGLTKKILKSAKNNTRHYP